MADETQPEQPIVKPTGAKIVTDTASKFALDSWGKPTPASVKNMFIMYYAMNTSILGWMGYTHLLPPTSLYELIGIFKFILDPAAYSISKMFGVVPANEVK